jgi:hypothetical protein
MCTLLPPGVAVSHGKKVLFVFLLEILTGNKGPKPEVFWHACKKRSRASQATRKAKRVTEASNPPPLPSAPAPVPTPLPSTVGTKPDYIIPPPGLIMEETCQWIKDVVMRPKTPSLPKSTPVPLFPATNQDFACSFPHLIGNTAPIRACCVEAHRCGFQWGQVCNSIRAAGHASLLLQGPFMNLVTSSFQSPLRPGKAPEAGPSSAAP